MYARVASFEGRDSSLTDQLIERVRDVGPSSVPDAKGFLGLFDRERGTSLGITFFDSKEAIRNSEQAFEDMAKNFPTEMRGRRASVDIHEVIIFDGDAGRFATPSKRSKTWPRTSRPRCAVAGPRSTSTR